MKIELQEKLTESELEAIKQQAPNLAEADTYVFSAKLIDDEPTANGRIWSREWQRANAELFIGVPVLVNHENDQELVLGRVYHAEQKENAIYGKVVVPLNTDAGRKGKEKIDAGLFKSVSINARANNVHKEGEYTRILPGENDRVFEVSFVAVGGCRSCTVQTESACESVQPERPDSWTEYARDLQQQAIDQVVKAAAFVFGEGFQEDAYRNIARKLAPDEVSLMAKDLQATYERLHSVLPSSEYKEAAQEWKPLNTILRNNRS